MKKVHCSVVRRRHGYIRCVWSVNPAQVIAQARNPSGYDSSGVSGTEAKSRL